MEILNAIAWAFVAVAFLLWVLHKPKKAKPAREWGTRVIRKQPKPEAEASDAFWDSFCGVGSLVQKCVCGRTHFSGLDRAGDWEEGEREKLLKLVEEKPDRYFVDYQNDSMCWIDFGAGPVVWGCPCHTAAKYEWFVKSFDREILQYLRARQRDLAKVAQDAGDRLEGL